MRSIILEAAALAALDPAPISPDWILAGTPQARSKVLAKSHDRTSSIMVWECTAGRFNWHYSEDETVVVISGEVFITSEKGEERRLGQGDVGFFPAGSSCTWRINDRVKKVAVLRKDMPLALGFGVRVWNKALRIAGFRGQSSLMPAVGYRSEPECNLRRLHEPTKRETSPRRLCGSEDAGRNRPDPGRRGSIGPPAVHAGNARILWAKISGL